MNNKKEMKRKEKITENEEKPVKDVLCLAGFLLLSPIYILIEIVTRGEK